MDYTSDPDNVIFTLADGKTKLTVPRTKILSVKFKDGCDIFSVTSVSNTIDIEFIGLTTENYKALVAELRSEDGTTDIDIVTRAENKDVEIKEPVFTGWEMYRNDSQNQQERNKWRKGRSESDSYR